MRATRSDDTVLNGAFVPDRYVARVLPGRRRWIRSSAALFAWALLDFGNIYYGLALRARDLAVAGASSKKTVAGASRARWPTTRRSSTRRPR